MRLRSRKMLFVILALLLAAGGVPIGIYQLQTWNNRNELTAVIAELDRAGEPWRLADLEKRRANIADERNSALVIRTAKPASIWKIMPDSPEIDLLPWQALPAGVCLKYRGAFEQFGENVKEARTLAAFPEGRFSYTIAPDVVSTLLPHVDAARPVAILLKHDAWWQIQQADFEQAAASCRAAVYTSRSLRDELFIISHLIRHAMLREVADTVERMCAQGQPDAKSLRELQRLFEEEAGFDGWTLALEGERAGMHQLFGHIADGKVNMQFVRAMTGARRSSWRDYVSDYFPAPSAAQSHAWLLRHFTDLLAANKLPPPERTAKLKQLGEEAGKAPDPARMLMAPPGFSPWTKLQNNQPRLEAKLRCTVAGLAAERFRLERKRWPDTIAALVPEYLAKAPLDPYTGEPLRLRATKDGMVISSAGPDGLWQGDAWDQLPRTAPDWGSRHEHEFRLWNVEQRRK